MEETIYVIFKVQFVFCVGSVVQHITTLSNVRNMRKNAELHRFMFLHSYGCTTLSSVRIGTIC